MPQFSVLEFQGTTGSFVLYHKRSDLIAAPRRQILRPVSLAEVLFFFKKINLLMINIVFICILRKNLDPVNLLVPQEGRVKRDNCDK